MERNNIVKAAGSPVTLTGNPVKEGDRAPGFTVLTAEMKEMSLADFSGKTLIISVTPSLDTPVCDLQATRFNQEAGSLSGDVTLLNISVDLPFALARFCAAKGIDRVKTLSDHRDVSFGTAYGVLMKESRLLARAIFIIDKGGTVRYVELVDDVTKQPDYDRAIAEAKKLS
jgi:thiol peroxidase